MLNCAILMSTLSVVQCLVELGCKINFSSMKKLDKMILDDNDECKELTLLIPLSNHNKYIQAKAEIKKYLSNLTIKIVERINANGQKY